MANEIKTIPLNRLVPHPDNPNQMSKANFARLVSHIKRTGRYEPLIVRRCPQKNCHSCQHRNSVHAQQEKKDCFQIINGHHRAQALRKLGYKTVDVIAWDIDDEQTDLLLATLNRLAGSDNLIKKLKLLRRLNKRLDTKQLATLLPHTKKQIEHLISLLDARRGQPVARPSDDLTLANPLVFFVNDQQQKTIDKALSLARKQQNEKTKAAQKAAALAYVARYFLINHKPTAEQMSSQDNRFNT